MIEIKSIMKNGYKMLIVCYRQTMRHIDEFTKHLLKENPNAVISLMTDMKQEEIPQSLWENMQEIFISEPKRSSIAFRPISTILNLYYFLEDFRFVSKNRHYDIVNIHFAFRLMVYALRYFRKMADKIVITIWGGDILCVDDNNHKQIRQLGRLYRAADMIAISPKSETGKRCISLFHTSPDRMKPVAWGMEMVDYIAEHEELHGVSEQEAKERFGLQNRFVIACGYCSGTDHRHEIIIDAIKSKIEKLPSNLTLLFQLSYGKGSTEYKQRIKDKCSEYGLEGKYIEEYLSFDDVYRLRKAVDVFVNIQPVDAGSRTVYEYILCNKKIVSGSWYKGHIYRFSPFYFPVNNIEDLGDVIVDACYSDNIETPPEVMQAVLSRGWNNKIKAWDEMFVSLVHGVA